MNLVKARQITVSGRLLESLWKKFRNTEAGSKEADDILAEILDKTKNRNEIYLVSCNARPGGEVYEETMKIIMKK